MSDYLSGNITSVMRFISLIISNYKLNTLVMKLLSDSLKSLSDIICELNQVNKSKNEKIIIRDLEKSIDKALRFIVKRLNKSKYVRILTQDSERFKLSTLMEKIQETLKKIALLKANKSLTNIQNTWEKLQGLEENFNKLSENFLEIETNLKKSQDSANYELLIKKDISTFIEIIRRKLHENLNFALFDEESVFSAINAYLKVSTFKHSCNVNKKYFLNQFKVSLFQINDFFEVFFEDHENKSRLLEYKIIPLFESNFFKNELFFLCLDDGIFHRKGDFLKIEESLNRNNLKNNYCSRKQPVAEILKYEIGYSVKPLTETNYVMFYNRLQIKICTGSYFEVVKEGVSDVFEFKVLDVNICKDVEDDDLETLPIKGKKSYFSLKINVTIGQHIDYEINYPLENHEILQDVIEFANGNVYLNSKKTKKEIRSYYYFQPFKETRLDSSTVIRFGISDYQVVYK